MVLLAQRLAQQKVGKTGRNTSGKAFFHIVTFQILVFPTKTKRTSISTLLEVARILSKHIIRYRNVAWKILRKLFDHCQIHTLKLHLMQHNPSDHSLADCTNQPMKSTIVLSEKTPFAPHFMPASKQGDQ